MAEQHLTSITLTDTEVRLIHATILRTDAELCLDLGEAIQAGQLATELLRKMPDDERTVFYEKLNAAYQNIKCDDPNCTIHNG